MPGSSVKSILRNESSIESFEGISIFAAGSKEPLKSRACPKCKDVRLSAKSVKGVNLDICENCNGIFFDSNEINDLFPKGLGRGTQSDKVAMGVVEIAIQSFVAILKGLG